MLLSLAELLSLTLQGCGRSVNAAQQHLLISSIMFWNASEQLVQATTARKTASLHSSPSYSILAHLKELLSNSMHQSRESQAFFMCHIVSCFSLRAS